MQKKAALLVIDLQNDFCPGGALAVPGGDEIAPLINSLARHFDEVVLTQDWHPADHTSFAANHPEKAAFDTIQLPYGQQILWPTHCVMGTSGAALVPGLDIPHAGLILRKGSHSSIDSYSGFLEADRATPTGLAGYLRERSITHLYICGLAFDFCVRWTAEDAAQAGFEVCVVEDACRAIDLQGSSAKARAAMQTAGVKLAKSQDILQPH